MPLKNRLQEVISRYERASQLVKGFKEGTLSEAELGNSFKQLRKERKRVDLHNRRFLMEQRRQYLGEEVDDDDNHDNNEQQLDESSEVASEVASEIASVRKTTKHAIQMP
jgi:GTP-sensing pleiotropic transcriptional regulator CodY